MKDHDQTPLLKDYTAFHGMLCAPGVARRCLQSFQDGVSLFAGQDDYDQSIQRNEKISNFDFNNILFPFNIWAYYLLVLTSLTGFCSLLFCTKVIEATECIQSFDAGSKDEPWKSGIRFKKGDNKHIESSKTTKKAPLRLPPEVLDYVIDRSAVLGPLPINKEIQDQSNSVPSGSNKTTTPELILLRRFEYDFGGFLSVMMLHLVCTNGRTHLVEIFRYDKGTVLGLVGRTLLEPLYILKSFFVKTLPLRQSVNNTKKTI